MREKQPRKGFVSRMYLERAVLKPVGTAGGVYSHFKPGKGQFNGTTQRAWHVTPALQKSRETEKCHGRGGAVELPTWVQGEAAVLEFGWAWAHLHRECLCISHDEMEMGPLTGVLVWGHVRSCLVGSPGRLMKAGDDSRFLATKEYMKSQSRESTPSVSRQLQMKGSQWLGKWGGTGDEGVDRF